MNYIEFLDIVIKDGLEEVAYIYQDQPNKRRGAVAGFKACEGLQPTELTELLWKAKKDTQAQYCKSDVDTYWEVRFKELQIEFVCNVVSAMLQNEGQDVIIPPTGRAVFKAAEILKNADDDPKKTYGMARFN